MKHNNFDFNQLIAFVAVAELESFKLAAEKVFISPPALSRRIEKLESSLGVRLFNRTTREVKLTPIGKSFYEKVKGALDDLELTALNIKDIADTYVSHITIACIPSVIDQFLLEPLNQLIKNYPKMKIRILDGSELSVIDHVQNGKVDFGITFLSSNTPGLSFTPLYSDQFVAVVPKTHPFAKQKKLAWNELLGHRLITVSQASGNRQMLNTHFTREGVFPSICIEVNRPSSIPNLVNEGLGIAIIPGLSFTAKNHPNLKAIPIERTNLKRDIGIIYQHGATLSPAAKFMVSAIQGLSTDA